jgi:translin
MTEELDRWLERLTDAAESNFAARNRVRDEALQISRGLIRLASRAIRAGHREAWGEARALLEEADEVAASLQEMLEPFPDIYFAGYTQDALKEWVEAHLTLIFVQGESAAEPLGLELPPPGELEIPYSTYLNGLCEAASELRRRSLDLMRRGEMARAERLLATMDAVYEVLMSFGYPDAITGGLRRRVDQLRGVLERTRGDLTNSLQMERLLEAMRALEDEGCQS